MCESVEVAATTGGGGLHVVVVSERQGEYSMPRLVRGAQERHGNSLSGSHALVAAGAQKRALEAPRACERENEIPCRSFGT